MRRICFVLGLHRLFFWHSLSDFWLDATLCIKWISFLKRFILAIEFRFVWWIEHHCFDWALDENENNRYGQKNFFVGRNSAKYLGIDNSGSLCFSLRYNKYVVGPMNGLIFMFPWNSLYRRQINLIRSTPRNVQSSEFSQIRRDYPFWLFQRHINSNKCNSAYCNSAPSIFFNKTISKTFQQ